MTPAASPDHAAVRAPTALITGAGSGIGRSTAQRLAATGWHCLLLDTDADSMARVIDTLPGRAARHRAIPIDLTDAAQVSALADLDRPIDAVINNAGRTASANQSLIEQATGEMDSLLALNLLAPAAVTGAVDRLLTPGARVVNVASGAGLRAIPYRGLYSATKAGLIEQTLALARARPDLAVSVVCPGFVRTDLVDALIAAGRLYPCYETPEELEFKRKRLLAQGRPPVYDRAALKLSDEDRRRTTGHDGVRLAAGAVRRSP